MLALNLFFNADLTFPCRGKKYAIKMCDATEQWYFEKFKPGDDDTSCVSKDTEAECAMDTGEYKGACSGAKTGNCPNDLAALINAWIKLRRRLQK